ncbi:trans-aconitate 2-methyltransferase [Streptomyces sp. NBC_00102]|uniref:class I SAM-dependent methyltransferase n=1 Tax=Streptomyces sp. NBC_00102 TaxID=2975652 RepID=UPI00224E53D2|nr:methyltransferase domain-containing protein [Streptomyces sp. NBC_00102]MCX5396812.1 class I SAM-dependent methyltransferase [Streptomyces sp. NBC_00102]
MTRTPGMRRDTENTGRTGPRPAAVAPGPAGPRAASVPPGAGQPEHSGRRLVAQDVLERSPVVANNTMNRGRGLAGVNSYARELGFDPLAHLLSRPACPSWLDLCSGEGRALHEAVSVLPADAVVTGVDLVGPMAPLPAPPGLERVVASVASWTPERTYALVTCVHGLHYVGDQLGLLARAASWVTDDGLLVAHFDPDSIRWADGAPAGRAAVRALRAAGYEYAPRHHRLTLRGGRTAELPFRYLGGDPAAGPNYTGQPAVASFYTPA